MRLLAIALAVILIASGVLSLVSQLARSTGHRDATYSGVSTVDVDLDFERLEVTSTDEQQVRLDRSFTWSFWQPTVRQERIGDRLVVSSSGCGLGFGVTFGPGCTGLVRLLVPRSVTLHLRTSNSDLVLRDLDGTVDAATSNGSVTVSALRGDVRLDSSNGTIEATAMRSQQVRASTSNGDVRLTFDAAPTQVTATSSNGDVVVLVPRDGSAYRVDATTSNDPREVTVPTDPRADRSIVAQTSNGTVRVLDRP